ncbi:MAG TPA: hypothetical protein VGN01_16225 [Acidobacteriaceae bacterium]
MATLVAPLEAQLAAQQTTRRRDVAFASLLVSGLTLFAVAIHGYHPYAEDGGLYLAGVQRLLAPALYPHATAFVLEPTQRSLFAALVASIVRLSHLPLPAVLLALHLATIWTTLFAAWMLAARCWSARTAQAGAVVLLACWLALPVAGTALLLMDPYLTARSLSTPCMVLALVAALDATNPTASRAIRWRSLAIGFGSLVLATAMHPLMAAYALGATLLLLTLRSSNPRIRTWGTASLSAAAVLVATVLQTVARPESTDYVRAALTRTYWFPAEWAWYELLGLAAPLAILALAALRAPQGPRRSLHHMALVLGATAWLIATVFSRAETATHLVARMQPLRAFQSVYLLMILTLGAALGEAILRRSTWRWIATPFLLGGILFGTACAAFPNSNHLELPWTVPRNLWTQAFVWVRANTPQDALFALDADYINAPGEDAQCFRAIAERSALPDYSKDGGEASIAPGLTPAWTQGQAVQQHLSELTDATRVAALAPLRVSWIVLKSKAVTEFDCPYQNAAVEVCRLP